MTSISEAAGRRAATIRVLIADDQDIVRAGLRMILDAQPGIEVVGEAADGREAIALARALRPDVCLFDVIRGGIREPATTSRLRLSHVRRPIGPRPGQATPEGSDCGTPQGPRPVR